MVIDLLSSDDEPAIRQQPHRGVKRRMDSCPELDTLAQSKSVDTVEGFRNGDDRHVDDRPGDDRPVQRSAERPVERPADRLTERPAERPTEQSTNETAHPTNATASTSSSLLQSWKSIESQLRCDICKSLMDVPVSLVRCYHTFCSFCIRRDFELGSNDSKCPCCRISASSSDIRLEPRLAQILRILAADNTRKRIRKQIGSSAVVAESRNATFVRQAKLAALFALGGSPIVRTVLPLYNNMKEKQLRELAIKDGLSPGPQIARDALVRHHKEFLLHCQALFDASRMGMYPLHPPTREGVAKLFSQKNPFEKKSSDLIDKLTTDAQDRMKEQLRNAIERRLHSRSKYANSDA